jgi:hypothetical protein
VQALAEQPDRFVSHSRGRSCRPTCGDNHFDEDEPIGSVRFVAGVARIHQKVAGVDLKKAMKEVVSLKAGGHLGF